MGSASGSRSPALSVLYVLYAFPQLSETFIENEIRVLRERGVRLEVASLFVPPPRLEGSTSFPRGQAHYRPSAIIVTFHALWWFGRRPAVSLANAFRALRCRSRSMLWGAWCAGWVASRAHASGAELIHAHFAYEPAAVAIAASKLSRLPYTVTVHALDMYVRTRGLDVRLGHADKVITVCEYNIGELRRLCPTLQRENIHLIYCGVDPSTFSCPPPTGADSRVLSVGRLVPKKGFDTLIRAIAQVRELGIDATCEIVGDGPERASLERLIRDLELSDVVRLSGALPPTAISEALCACDLFVLACRIVDHGDRDSMPLALKEAMASGRPVIATNTVGIPELVDDEVGWLVPADDETSLADAIAGALRLDESELKRLGVAGRRRVEERFNLHLETAKLEELFAHVVK